jgi:leucyl aminopeptidase
MPGRLELEFAPLGTPAKGVLVLFCEEELKFGSVARGVLSPTGDLVRRAASADGFKGKNGSALDLVAPAGLEVPRLLIVGVGKGRDLKARDFIKLGGAAMGRIPSAASDVTLIADLPGGAFKPERAADMARAMGPNGEGSDAAADEAEITIQPSQLPLSGSQIDVFA